MISIFTTLLKHRGFPLWLAGQICFSLSCLDIIAAPNEDQLQTGDIDYEIACCPDAVKFGYNPVSSPNPPDISVSLYEGLTFEFQYSFNSEEFSNAIVKTDNTYLLYLLKRPPPAAHTTL